MIYQTIKNHWEAKSYSLSNGPPVDVKHAHNVFHISQLNKYDLDHDHAIVLEPIELIKNLLSEEHLVQILDRRIK